MSTLSVRHAFPHCNGVLGPTQSPYCVGTQSGGLWVSLHTDRRASINPSTTCKVSGCSTLWQVAQKPRSIVSFSAPQGPGDIFVHLDFGREPMPVTLFWVLLSLGILIDWWPKLRYTLSGTFYKMEKLHELQKQMAATAVMWNLLFLGWK